MKNFKQYIESEQKPLSSDVSNDDLEINDEKVDDKWEIKEILDIFNDPSEISEDTIKESVIGQNTDLSNKVVKRGDVIWITALLKRKGSSMNSPSVQGILELRVKDIWYGMSKLNKVLKQ